MTRSVHPYLNAVPCNGAQGQPAPEGQGQDVHRRGVLRRERADERAAQVDDAHLADHEPHAIRRDGEPQRGQHVSVIPHDAAVVAEAEVEGDVAPRGRVVHRHPLVPPSAVDIPILSDREQRARVGEHALAARGPLGAAMGGNVKCLQFALECGAPFDPAYAAMLAAQKGHLDALVFVHAKAGAPMAWRPSTLYWAALNNHVGCARYLLEHMRPLSRRQVADALAAAKMGACRDCMFLLHDALHA